jgi:prepilin-type N-terminal cleavage/methylation domain-containing protein
MEKNRRVGTRNAFPLVEMLVVVVIVAILALTAVPIYGRHIKNSRVTEATARISDIIMAAKSYAMANHDAAGNPTWPPAAGGGIVSLTSTAQFDYAITAGAAANASTTPLVITATGIAGGKMAGVAVTVTVPNIRAGGVVTTDLGSTGTSGGGSGTGGTTGGRTGGTSGSGGNGRGHGHDHND